ncbi:MAG: hypothetical protein ACTH2Y_09250 [Corynebacterium sp.]|uniref:hypothetical protein n=1 Tax=unclassified Corynebacterium TaxID=2624378 RepID=UPI003F908A98
MSTIDRAAAPLIILFFVFALGFIYATAHSIAGPTGLTAALAATAFYVWGRYVHRPPH